MYGQATLDRGRRKTRGRGREIRERQEEKQVAFREEWRVKRMEDRVEG